MQNQSEHYLKMLGLGIGEGNEISILGKITFSIRFSLDQMLYENQHILLRNYYSVQAKYLISFFY